MTTAELDRATAAEALPPGPHLPTLLQTLLYLVARTKLVTRCERRYGKVFTLRIAGQTYVMVSTPEHIQDVFTSPASVFRAGEANLILASVVGKNSLFVLDDKEHLRSRKRLMPAFNGAALRGYADMMTELATADAEQWPIGRPFAVHKRTSEMTLEIILRVVFGMADGDRLADLRPLVREVTSRGRFALLSLVYPKLEPYWPWRRNRELLDAMDSVLFAELAHRRTAGDLAERSDVLSRLLVADDEFSEAALRDHMVTFVLAGHETTATALAWAYYELARRPVVLRAAQDAADRGDDGYLLAVVKEAMRHRPVSQNAQRKLTEPATVAGYDLPAGTVVAPNIYLVQRDPGVYPDPEDFRPERFVGKGPEAGTWIPFGGGVRRCIGAAFAEQEAVASLRAVLTRYDIRPASRRPETAKARNVTLIPSRGAQIIATPR